LSFDDASAAGEVVTWASDGAHADGFAISGGVDHLPIPEVKTNVVDLGVGVAVEDEVAGLEIGFGDPRRGVVLGVRCARQVDAGSGVSGGDETGTVETSLPSFGPVDPKIRQPDLAAGVVERDPTGHRRSGTGGRVGGKGGAIGGGTGEYVGDVLAGVVVGEQGFIEARWGARVAEVRPRRPDRVVRVIAAGRVSATGWGWVRRDDGVEGGLEELHRAGGYLGVILKPAGAVLAGM
jgi:hypothetical protein